MKLELFFQIRWRYGSGQMRRITIWSRPMCSGIPCFLFQQAYLPVFLIFAVMTGNLSFLPLHAWCVWDLISLETGFWFFRFRKVSQFAASSAVIASYLFSTKRTQYAIPLNACRSIVFNFLCINFLPLIFGGDFV